MRNNLKLPLGVWVQGRCGKFFQQVEYEEIPLLCFKCDLVKHKVDSCPMLKTAKEKCDPPRKASMAMETPQ